MYNISNYKQKYYIIVNFVPTAKLIIDLNTSAMLSKRNDVVQRLLVKKNF